MQGARAQGEKRQFSSSIRLDLMALKTDLDPPGPRRRQKKKLKAAWPPSVPADARERILDKTGEQQEASPLSLQCNKELTINAARETIATP